MDLINQYSSDEENQVIEDKEKQSKSKEEPNNNAVLIKNIYNDKAVKIGNGVYSRININPSTFQDNLQKYQNGNIINKATVIAGKNYSKQVKLKREKYGTVGTGTFRGPWGSYKGEEELKNQGELSEEQKDLLSQLELRRMKNKDIEYKEMDKFETTSVYHFSEDPDYAGRSFINPPKDVKDSNHTCYLPKRLIHTYTGHTKQVTKIKLFPSTGHLLLSSSSDCKVKIWDVKNKRKCARTYLGHTETVKDISFSHDGYNFVSVGLDKIINYWDSETGKAILTLSNKKIPLCTAMNPEGSTNSFIVGTSQKSIVQYDTRSGEISQSYDEHLGSINTLTFIDKGKKFISTSDDKKLYVWEYGIPVVLKHISDPTMHSITSFCLHPNKQNFLGQSLDNKIIIFDETNSYRVNRKKTFTGHVTSGYTCGIDISSDGQYVVSGDSNGGIWFWDWKTSKNYKVIEAYNKICSDIKWHPYEPSKLFSASWDGTIKLWD